MVKLIAQCVRFTPKQYFSAKPKPLLNDAVSTSFINNEVKYRNHEGIIKPRLPEFPQWASQAIHCILKEKRISSKTINENVKKLVDYLKNRRLPFEQADLPKTLIKVEERLNAKNIDNKISIENIDFQKDFKARKILKQQIYNWQPINFNKLTCLTYLVGRSVQNYTVCYKILNEIKVRDKNFQPKTLFDFGSGIGTVTWAASQIWPNSLKEYLCIETSEAMIELSEILAKNAKPRIKELFYRQYFPPSVNPRYDIVVSAYSLLELPNANMRLDTILKLWKKTEHYLIIVENGTNAGFKVINEARDFILKYATSRLTRDKQDAHVFSPCPHELTCPRFTTDNTPCNFEISYLPLKCLHGNEHKQELYSYIVIKKGKRRIDDEKWPRIVRAVLDRSGHSICRMCMANGKLKEQIFTKYKHGTHLYRCARSSEWGDRLPMHYEEEETNAGEDNTTNETTTIE